MNREKPNIIFIQCDSMDGRLMGCMGHPAMRGVTPNMDRLAEEGVLFRNTYCNNPVCCPSRASMWSGLYTHHCEGWNNYKGLSKSDTTFLDPLTLAGYRQEMFGKSDYLSGGHTIRARVSPWTRSANITRPNYRMAPPRVLDDQGPRTRTRDWERVDGAVEWLHREGSAAERFFLHVGIGAPHPAFRTSRHYLNRIDESRVDIPPVDENPHRVLVYQRCVKNWMHGFSDETVQLVRRIYFAMISEVDSMLGELLKAVEEAGLKESTYVIFTSDHGELAMEHRQFYKMSPYEGSARVPLIVRGPGAARGSDVGTPVSLVDIYPTLMDIAGLPSPEGLDGYSLIPELTGSLTEHPGWSLTEFHGSTCSTGCFALRKGDWKYIVYVGHPSQLFNLKDDPYEIDNLTERRPEVVKEMDDLLRGIVDCEAVDAKVKAYDRASFTYWREEHLAAGDYRELMTRIFSGWDRLEESDLQPWTGSEEAIIREWLGESG